MLSIEEKKALIGYRKQKAYDSLKEDYVKRFTEVSGNAPTVDAKPEDKSDEPVNVTIDDLDFDATTE